MNSCRPRSLRAERPAHSVPAETERILQTATLLGGNFTVTDLAVLLRRPVLELAAGLQEAVTAGILAGSGSELAFRHR